MLDAHPAPDALARPSLPALAIDPPASPARPVAGDALYAAARTLLPILEAGRPLDAAILREAMTQAFGASDADGAWVWKDAYEAAEAAAVLFVQRYGRAMRRQAGAGPHGPRRMLAMLDAIAALEPSHTKRSGEQVRLQQFSTPLPLAYAALQAAAIRPGDTVLEPSAGTGMLAVMAECAMGAQAAGNLHLNEYAAARARLLTHLFPQAVTTAFNAEAIADRLHDVQPTVVLMNPPFSATPGVDRIRHDADLRHIRSAFAMLPPGGRLAAITSANCLPGDPAWRDAFDSVDGGARVVFTMAIDGRAYARRGTGFDTRLTVIDRSSEPGIDIDREARAADAAELLDAVIAKVPPRLPIMPEAARPIPAGPARDLFGKPARPPATKGSTGANSAATPATAHDWGPVELVVGSGPGRAVETGAPDTVTHESATQANAGPYDPWRPGVARVPGAIAHPTPLVQSAAMAAVPHPVPTYRPMLPERVVADGLLSDAQLESIVLAGEAHDRHLAADYRIGAGWETVQRCPEEDGDDDGTAVMRRHRCHRRRRGAVRPGTLPARLDARRRHRRGQGPPGRRHHARPLAARPQARALAVAVRQAGRGRKARLVRARRARGRRDPAREVPPGGRDSPMAEGILFATYATLRSPARQGKTSRLDQIVAWLAGSLDEDDRHAFDGAVIFDEAHAMANAAGSKGNRGEVKPSQQGRAGPQAPERAAGRAHRLCLGHRRHHRPRPRLCRQARALGRRRDAVRDPRRVRHRHGGRRRRRDGGGRARPQGPRPLPGPGALL